MISPRGLRLIRRLATSVSCSRQLCTDAGSAISTKIGQLSSNESKLHNYWINHLHILDNVVARRLILELSPDNSFGFSPQSGVVKEGTLLKFAVRQKDEYPDKLVLFRVGEFYEAFGVDAIMLVQYAGLNPMGGRARAGCPVRNVQAVLNSLTGFGFSVAVFEEVNDIDWAGKTASGKAKIKHRVLSQIVSPASSTYLYDLSLSQESIEYRDNRPVVGILPTVSGYSITQIYVDEKCIVLKDRLTEEALRVVLQGEGYMEPLFVCSTVGQGTRPALPHFLRDGLIENITVQRPAGPSVYHDQILRRVGKLLAIDTSGFRVVRRTHEAEAGPHPIYLATAQQIGLLPNDNIPAIVPHLLPVSHRSYCSKFLRKYLLTPPPYTVAQSFRSVLGILIGQGQAGGAILPALPAAQPVSVGKVISLLSSGQCNAATFREIEQTLSGVLRLLELAATESVSNYTTVTELVAHLVELGSYESGVTIDQREFAESVRRACGLIRERIAPHDCSEVRGGGMEADQLVSRDPSGRVPDDFFDRNESEFRGSLVSGGTVFCNGSFVITTMTGVDNAVDAAFRNVRLSAEELCRVIAEDFPLNSAGFLVSDGPQEKYLFWDPVFDPVNNIICFKKRMTRTTPRKLSGVDVPSESVKHHTHEIIHPSDRYGQQIVNRYTSLRVNQALSSYIASAGQARTVTKHALREMCTALLRESLTIVQASHVALLLQVAVLHATASRQKGWVLPVVENTTVSAQRVALTLHGMRPYWMDGAGSRAVSNDVEMNGIFLLTAPNMSGKSTLMRSILVTALLANCGLFVPCLRASVPRYDSFFLRTASHDTPLEGKSAFAVEMDDIRVMMRDSTQKSLVMIDEIGKGTSSRDGAAFAGALLEWMSSTGMHGIFATHLHELLHMKLNLDNVKMKRMGVTLTAPDPAWTYCLEDGSCTNSMAFITARAFGITSSLIDRALEIQRAFDHESNMTGILEATKSIANSVSGEGDHDNKYSVERVSRVLREEVVNDESLGSLLHSSSISVVRDGHFTSPLSEGRSAVYVLIKRECKHASDWDWNQSMRNGKPCPNCSCAILYVGETDSIYDRLSAHRKNSSYDCALDALVIAALDKSAARRLETNILHLLIRDGYIIENIGTDHRHVRFGAYSASKL